MPLAATIDNERIEAHRATDEEWVSLKSRYKRGSLVLACGESGIPKTNRHGTKFFAHKPGIGCSGHEGGPESADHLEAKARIVEAAREAGWAATIEFAGPGRGWIADVMAENGQYRIALEVQWSSQTSADFARRQKRYEDAGLKCFWFINRRNERAALEADVPFATFFGGGIGWVEMTPLVPPERGFYPTLHEAVQHVLAFEYRRKFEPSVNEVELGLERHHCPTCRQETICFFLDRVQISTPCGGVLSYYSRERVALQTYVSPNRYGPERNVQDEVREELLTRGFGTAAVIEGGEGEPVSFSCGQCGSALPSTMTSWRRHRESVNLPALSSLKFHAGLTTARHICVDRGQGKCSQAGKWMPDQIGAFYGKPLTKLAIEAARMR